MVNKLSLSRGSLAPLGVTIMLLVFGVALTTQLFTPLWIIGIFGVVMLLTAFCFTGIEFNTEKHLYREYYCFLFLLKLGKWHSYKEFKFVSLQGVTLASTASLPNIPVNMGTNYEQSAKIILLNELHNKKLFIIYSKKPQKTKAIIEQLISILGLPFAKYNPPISEKTKQRRLNRGKNYLIIIMVSFLWGYLSL